MKNGKLQAKDLPDADIVAAIKATQGLNGVPHWSARSDIDARPPQWPRRVVLAKLASLVKRKIISGCTCGCRGDFEFGERWPG